jgi:hypothetical protein
MIILVDSGSSHSLVNAKLADVLQGQSTLPSAVRVQVANGQVMQSNAELKKAKWSIQGHDFYTDL